MYCFEEISAPASQRSSDASPEIVNLSDFSPIHKIVLGLSLQALGTEFFRDPNNIGVRDVMGRTALEWAAARGDD